MVQFQGNFGGTRITILSIILFIWIAHACLELNLTSLMATQLSLPAPAAGKAWQYLLVVP